MKSGQPSNTAIIVASHRAAHLYIDDEPKIYEDRLALSFIGEEYKSLYETGREYFQTPQVARARSFVLCRCRYTEDALYEALDRGVKQYVILGAGLDSFAYQYADTSDKLKIFEVDHPESQKWKRERIKDTGLSLPRNVTFVPIDFRHQSLEDGLVRGGYIPEDPTFFSWLGVTYYLPVNSVFDTLNYVATAAAPDSEIVFDYAFPDSMLTEDALNWMKNNKESFAKLGEPMISTFSSDFIISKLREMGFNQITEIDENKIKEYKKKYFLDRTDGLLPEFGTNGITFIKARVQRQIANH